MKRSILTFIGVALLALPLAACEKSDTDVVVDFMQSWMKDKGILDADGKPTLQAGIVATGFGTTGDDRVDAAVQAGTMLQSLHKADKLVDEAGDAMMGRPRDSDLALNKMNAAIDMRPDDWSYLNRRGVVHMENGNKKAAQADFAAAITTCNGSQACIDRVNKDREAVGWDVFGPSL
ncbi:MAG: hypothetical protein HOO67_02740 [Candidatus Peribacteraceae bacterium]|nr:hypothetical protein [Candidatus Peribacteraceae bacterium]